jgi:hypothetical protein
MVLPTKSNMKTYQPILFFLVLFLSLMSEISAQKGFNAGINGGYNATFMIDRYKLSNVPYNLNIKGGPAFGLALGYNFNEHFGFEAEGNYAALGSAYSIPDGSTHTLKSFDLGYYQVPVLFKYTGGDFLTRFSSMAGPVFGFLRSAKINSDSDRNMQNSFRATDFGILFSAGGDVTLAGNLYMNIALRLYYGLTTINTDPKIVMNSPDENDRLSNTYIGINIGLYNMFVKPKPDKAPDW